MSLTIRQLQTASVERNKTAWNGVGTKWTPAQWLQAMIGEVGEYANFRKKFERDGGDPTVFHQHVAKELADIQIYLVLLAESNHVDLESATINKYNEVNRRQGVHGVDL